MRASSPFDEPERLFRRELGLEGLELLPPPSRLSREDDSDLPGASADEFSLESLLQRVPMKNAAIKASSQVPWTFKNALFMALIFRLSICIPP